MPSTLSARTAQEVRDRIVEIPGVAGLYGGHYGEIALLFPREKVLGMRKLGLDGESGLEIHLVVNVHAARGIAEIANDVRRAAQEVTGMQPVDIIVADAVLGDDTAKET